MGFFSTLSKQTGAVLGAQSPARKAMLGLIIVGCLAAMAFIVFRAQTGGYTELYTDMSPNDVGAALTSLKQQGIDAKAGPNSTSVLVARNDADEASMALATGGLLTSGQLVGYEKMDAGAIGQSNYQQQKQYLRMREGELARSLMTIKSVMRARVHLAMPEQTAFVEDQRRPTASVNLVLRSGARLAENQIHGIVNLVSYAIEGMEPDDVNIVDQDGNLLTHEKGDPARQAASAQQGVKMAYEAGLKKSIEDQLEKFVGFGKVNAQVMASFDFSTLSSQKSVFNPEEQEPMKLREETALQSQSAAAKGAVSSAPGSSSNLPQESGGATKDAAGGPADQQSQTQRTEYAVSETRETIENNVPKPTRVSVSVAVDGVYTTDAKGVRTFARRNDQEMTEITDLVKAAVGFDSERGDVVKVQCHEFSSPEGEDAGTAMLNYEKRRMIQQGVEWGVVALIALLLIFMVLRPAVRQIIVTPVEASRGKTAGALPAGGKAGDGRSMKDLLPERMRGDKRIDDFRELLHKAHLRGEELTNNRDRLLALAREAGLDEDSMQELEIESLAAAAMDASIKSEQIQKQIQDAVKDDPRKTASLLRVWMEEG